MNRNNLPAGKLIIHSDVRQSPILEAYGSIILKRDNMDPSKEQEFKLTVNNGEYDTVYKIRILKI
jgi:hypothetical protein